jgi:hypothetical protein
MSSRVQSLCIQQWPVVAKDKDTITSIDIITNQNQVTSFYLQLNNTSLLKKPSKPLLYSKTVLTQIILPK